MINWNNLDTLEAFKELKETPLVDLNKVMSGEAGAERVKTYNIPMAEGLNYNFAANLFESSASVASFSSALRVVSSTFLAVFAITYNSIILGGDIL